MIEQNSKPNKIYKILLVGLVTIIFLIVVLVWFVPYNNIAAQQIKKSLESSGLNVSAVEIEKINASETRISQLAIGDDKSLKIENIVVQYNLQDASSGQLQSVAIDEIETEIYLKDNNWVVGGLEQFFDKPLDENTKIDLNSVYASLPAKVSIKDINISAKNKDVYFSTNVKLDMISDRNKKELSGNIIASSITVAGLPFDILQSELKGEFSADSKNFFSKLVLRDKASSVNLDAEIAADSSDLKQGRLKIKKLTLPFGGGSININNTSIPLAMDKPVPLVINIQEVELSELLGKATADEIKGDGKLSGAVNVVYYPNGQVRVRDGYMSSKNEGVINVSPSLIPGDNEQIKMTRTVLENFHYKVLNISIVSDKEEKSLINLAIEGQNPKYLEGKKVKLNVNLSGDTIPMLKQSLLPMNDFKKLIDTGNTDEK